MCLKTNSYFVSIRSKTSYLGWRSTCEPTIALLFHLPLALVAWLFDSGYRQTGVSQACYLQHRFGPRTVGSCHLQIGSISFCQCLLNQGTCSTVDSTLNLRSRWSHTAWEAISHLLLSVILQVCLVRWFGQSIRNREAHRLPFLHQLLDGHYQNLLWANESVDWSWHWLVILVSCLASSCSHVALKSQLIEPSRQSHVLMNWTNGEACD